MKIKILILALISSIGSIEAFKLQNLTKNTYFIEIGIQGQRYRFQVNLTPDKKIVDSGYIPGEGDTIIKFHLLNKSKDERFSFKFDKYSIEQLRSDNLKFVIVPSHKAKIFEKMKEAKVLPHDLEKLVVEYLSPIEIVEESEYLKQQKAEKS